MTGSRLQLSATGAQDVFLTKSNELKLNMFKYKYHKYVNFSTDTHKLILNQSASFGSSSSCDILKYGHLLSKMFLHLKLPKLVKIDGTYACWSDSLGYAIFNSPIELQIGGITVDKIYPRFADIYDDLTRDSSGNNLMLLKSDVYSSTKLNATKDIDLIIPLDFFFAKKYSMALPLLSMDQNIKITFQLKNFEDLIHYDGNIQPQNVNIIESYIFAEYIFLDDTITDLFKTQKHQYIIDQVQLNEEYISGNSFNASLNFNNPCKELIFCFGNNIDNNYFNYSNVTGDPFLKEATLFLDGKKRYDTLPEFYYRSIIPRNIHSVIPMKYIYIMPFCLKPEDNQPTGSLNMNRFTDVILSLSLNNNNSGCSLYVYAITYNVITIENGMLSLEFMY